MTDTITLAAIRVGLASPDPAVRAECIDALAVLGDVAGLLAALGAADAYVRDRAVRTLGFVAGRRVTWRLARLLWDRDSHVRTAVADAMARRGGHLSLCALHLLARDGHAVVRYRALRALAALGGCLARAQLRVASATANEAWIRDAATALLRRCETPGVGPVGKRPLVDSHGLKGMS